EGPPGRRRCGKRKGPARLNMRAPLHRLDAAAVDADEVLAGADLQQKRDIEEAATVQQRGRAVGELRQQPVKRLRLRHDLVPRRPAEDSEGKARRAGAACKRFYAWAWAPLSAGVLTPPAPGQVLTKARLFLQSFSCPSFSALDFLVVGPDFRVLRKA